LIGSIANSLQKEKRIAEAEPQEIKKAIAYGIMAMGLRGDNMPQDIEKAFLLEWIPKHLPRYTLTEFKAAFDLAASKKINVDHHYQKFSVSYLGQLMKAYEEQYRTKVVEHMNKLQSQKQQVQTPSPSERKKIKAAFVQTCIIKPIKQSKGKILASSFPCSLKKVFQYFAEAGLIDMKNLNKEEIKQRNEKKLRQDLEQMSQHKSRSPQEYQEKRRAIELLKPENAKEFENMLQDICRMETIQLICTENEIEVIEQKLLK